MLAFCGQCIAVIGGSSTYCGFILEHPEYNLPGKHRIQKLGVGYLYSSKSDHDVVLAYRLKFGNRSDDCVSLPTLANGVVDVREMKRLMSDGKFNKPK
jgi:hypothetical protein